MALCQGLRTGIIRDEVTGGLPGVFLEDAIEVSDVLETGLVARNAAQPRQVLQLHRSGKVVQCVHDQCARLVFAAMIYELEKWVKEKLFERTG